MLCGVHRAEASQPRRNKGHGVERRGWFAVLAITVFAVTCQNARPPPAGSTPRDHDDAEASELDLDAGASTGPPSLDAGGLCGNQLIEQVVERPNLYFVLDRSGSMAEAPGDEGETKYESVRIALREVLREVGHRVRYGAAVFPETSASTECAAGVEVFETREGDSVAYVLQGELGPTLSDLLRKLERIETQGSTPISATLAELSPTIEGLEGETVVILATDGEPNCGGSDSCEPSDCGLVQSGYVLGDGSICSEELNCCDSDVVGNGPEFCIDDVATTENIRELAEAGIRTYVIGLPGSERAASVLNAMAVAGGVTPEDTAESGGRASEDQEPYYAVAEMGSLASVLKKITTSVAIQCTLELETAPPESSMVNVYFDGVVIPADPVNGWELTSERALEIKGDACNRLGNGDVYQVQIVAGCPTVVL